MLISRLSTPISSTMIQSRTVLLPKSVCDCTHCLPNAMSLTASQDESSGAWAERYDSDDVMGWRFNEGFSGRSSQKHGVDQQHQWEFMHGAAKSGRDPKQQDASDALWHVERLSILLATLHKLARLYILQLRNDWIRSEYQGPADCDGDSRSWSLVRCRRLPPVVWANERHHNFSRHAPHGRLHTLEWKAGIHWMNGYVNRAGKYRAEQAVRLPVRTILQWKKHLPVNSRVGSIPSNRVCGYEWTVMSSRHPLP
ncbi:hypothetical protein EDC04DRAFT_2780887 [Pisolithus marmoratus]|nr:hypothetical protein EDC04DRAFT_2780887 [Pisolithus marmoratus]